MPTFSNFFLFKVCHVFFACLLFPMLDSKRVWTQCAFSQLKKTTSVGSSRCNCTDAQFCFSSTRVLSMHSVSNSGGAVLASCSVRDSSFSRAVHAQCNAPICDVSWHPTQHVIAYTCYCTDHPVLLYSAERPKSVGDHRKAPLLSSTESVAG